MTETGRRIARASGVVLLAHLIFKVSGFLQALVIPRAVGEDTVLLELFAFGFMSVLYNVYLIGEEGLGPAFLPVFMGDRDRGDEAGAWRFANTVITLQVIVIAAVVAIFMLLPAELTRLLTDWEGAPEHAEKFARAPAVVRWMIPGLFGLSVGSTTYLILNGHKRFFLAALGDAATKFVIILLAVIGAATGGEMLVWLCAGVVGGSLAKLGTHLAGLRDRASRFRPRLDLTSPAAKRFFLLILPLLIGIVFAKVRDIFNETYVLSNLPGMLVSANAYGKKLFQTVGWLIPYSASIAMYPFFCELVDRENRPELARVVEVSGHVINVFCLPITAVVVALSLPLVTQLYESDAFTPRMCDQAALANAAFTLVLPFYALEYVFMQAFFSNRRMWTPIVLGLVMSALSMLLCYAGAVIFNEPLTGALAALGLVDPGAAGSTAVLVVGLAYTVSRALKVISLGLLMKRFLPDLNGARAVWFACRAALAGLAAGAATYGVRHLYERRVDTAAPEGFMANLPVQGPLLVLGGLAGLGAYLVVLRLVCPAEWAETVHWTRARLAAWRGGGDETPPAAP